MSEAKPKATMAPKTAPAAATPASASNVVIIKGKPLSTRGRTFAGTVTSNKMAKTVTVEWERRKYVTKYQRYEKRRRGRAPPAIAQKPASRSAPRARCRASG